VGGNKGVSRIWMRKGLNGGHPSKTLIKLLLESDYSDYNVASQVKAVVDRIKRENDCWEQGYFKIHPNCISAYPFTQFPHSGGAGRLTEHALRSVGERDAIEDRLEDKIEDTSFRFHYSEHP